MDQKLGLTEKDYISLIPPYADSMNNIVSRLDILASDYKFVHNREPIHHIQKRIKMQGSIEAKLRHRELPVTSDSAKENLRDIAGVRVICYSVQEIYQIAGLMKKQMDLEVIKETDYIRAPKESGYRSYHLVLGVPIYHVEGMEYYPVEIQFRTMAMDLWASLEHRGCYKKEEIDQQKRRTSFLKYARLLQEIEEEIALQYL